MHTLGILEAVSKQLSPACMRLLKVQERLNSSCWLCVANKVQSTLLHTFDPLRSMLGV